MKALLRHRPSASMVIACLALFVALGGVGYAAATFNGKNIINGTVTGKKLKNGTITGTQVKKNGLGGGSIKESSLGTVPSAQSATTAGTAANATKATTAETAVKATTAENAVTLNGVAAAQYLNGYQVVTASVGPASSPTQQVFVNCPAGKVLIGGGSSIGGTPGTDVALQRDLPIGPADAPNQWFGQAVEVIPTATDWSLSATAICVNAP